jgi:hypothetical protein
MDKKPFVRKKADFLIRTIFVIAGSLYCIWAITAPALKAFWASRPLPGRWTWGAIILFDLGFLMLCLLSCEGDVVQLLTKFTEDGIVQPSFPHSKSIRWQDIRKISGLTTNRIHISSETTKLYLSPLLFRNPREFAIEIKERIPRAAFPDATEVHQESLRHKPRVFDSGIMSFISMRFAKRIVIDVNPSQFVFTDQKDNQRLAFATYLYVDTRGLTPALVAIGEYTQKDFREEDGIQRIDVFNFEEPLPLECSTLTRDDLIEAIFEYGIGRIYEKYWLPQIRPVVFIRGIDQFNVYFENPRDVLKVAAKRSGASVVIFDGVP